MAAYYLAVDIGASSGRHIIGHMENRNWQDSGKYGRGHMGR